MAAVERPEVLGAKIAVFGYMGAGSDIVTVDAIDVTSHQPVGEPVTVPPRTEFFKPGYLEKLRKSILLKNSGSEEQKMKNKNNWLKFIVGWFTCFAIRIIPFRPPNVEPVLATTMPFSKKYGPEASFLFGFLSIVLFDLFTQKIGVWTMVTAVTYGLLGLGSYFYFRKRKSNSLNYLKYAIFGTIAYDALTGLTIGPLVFKMPFMVALVGQIPFTVNHLLGNIVLSIILSPALYKWVIDNQNLSIDIIWARLAKSLISR